MACYRPLQGWLSKRRSPNGKRQVVFSISDALTDRPVSVPCGQCVGCRLERSRQWAIRCTHESKCWSDNMFLTLTYNDDKLPGPSLVKEHFQLFMKRYRKSLSSNIKFFHCGEYGTKSGRPHYHALIFGHRFDDLKLHQKTDHGPLFTSETLEHHWRDVEDDKPLGFCTIGQVTFESAAYTARYVMKKQLGKDAEDYYSSRGIIPEYCTQSNGIGEAWFHKHYKDWYRDDFIVVEGRPCGRPPRYYDKLLAERDPVLFADVKRRRIAAAKEHQADQTSGRLRVREEVREARIRKLERKI